MVVTVLNVIVNQDDVISRNRHCRFNIFNKLLKVVNLQNIDFQKFMFFAFISLVLSYNIYRGDCEAILDTYKYDLTKFIGGDPYIITGDDYTYYIRMCPEPGEGDRQDVFLMQCGKGSGKNCIDVITQNSLDYKPRNPQNFSEGLIYFADSEPYTENNNTYKTLDLTFDLICDPTAVDTKIDFTYVIDDQSSIGQITARGRTDAACPKTVPSPTPTPVYEPDCHYTDRKDDDSDIGIDGDLALLNDGPFGVKTHIIVDGVEKTLFYQACERMKCPPTYTCSSDIYSSAWLCDKDERTCDSYGVSVDDINLKPVSSSSLASGMIYRMEETTTGKSVNLTLWCSETYPDGHILWSDKGQINDDTLIIGGQAKEFCLKVIPTPNPPPVGGPCSFRESFNEELVSINLATYNLGNTGWTANVTVDATTSHPNSTLIYQPCGGIMCPADTYCDGDEDAEVWLCYTQNDFRECVGYGLYKNNVSISLYNPTDIDGGLLAHYTGDNRRFADVTIYCNQFLEPDTFELPNYVTLIDRRLSFYVSAKDACPATLPEPTKGPSPSASPVPISWHPKKPTKPVNPTPTPQPTVSPNFFLYDDTKYINLSLDELKQQIFSSKILVSHDKQGDYLNVSWHPWIRLGCPSGYNCGVFKYANMWTCWVEDDKTNYCHPTADNSISLEARLATSGDGISSGFILDYGGGYGFDTKFIVECNGFESESISFDDGADTTYYDDPRLSVIVDSSIACPKNFATPTLPPTPAPTPTIDPNAKPDRSFTSNEYDGKEIRFDLNDYSTYKSTVILSDNGNVIKSVLVYNPSGVQSCPDGYYCVTQEKSSLWNCINSTTRNNICIPIGDDRYGLKFTVPANSNDINKENHINKQTEINELYGIPNKVSVTYGGGYSDTSAIINLICDEGVSGFLFQTIGSIENNNYIYNVNTNAACPVDKSRKVISGGAIFLICVIIICVLYFAIGMIVNYVKDGIIMIPNAGFWNEFGLSISAAVAFLFSCGKTKEITLQSNYDKIT
ncbi:hypothetical protein TRFO_12915 [Tritrichomonas foetus]|uniref:Autophagy-related protein 27 n=1 Tax=Tritrichomonas foetus TaxID=1144522 RepID=A0A1J4L4G1_9EUKA|nr:hypothetical protein TRFO_12915 [Tritrichomonas foetus]|eukprot:OHT16830.1 hypothetical protein TRFO_12915 [Tritrichomonas foetus]